jgi:hypothetical protein
VKDMIDKYGIRAVWHFTDRENIASIEREGGILSLAELERRGIELPVYGGNEWSQKADRQRGLDQFVHLTFIREHPMQYLAVQEGRFKEPIWIRIDSAVLLEAGVRYCAGVSNRSGSEILGQDEAISRIDFDELFTYTDWNNPAVKERRKAAVKSEILVPTIVPWDRVVGIEDG